MGLQIEAPCCKSWNVSHHLFRFSDEALHEKVDDIGQGLAGHVKRVRYLHREQEARASVTIIYTKVLKHPKL